MVLSAQIHRRLALMLVHKKVMMSLSAEAADLGGDT